MPIRHQLNIHLDYGPQCAEPGGLEIRYGYHHSGVHRLREQVIRISESDIEPGLKIDLDTVYEALRRRIPVPDIVHLPHADILPEILPLGLTFVVQDQTRSEYLPIARLYYDEEVAALKPGIQKQVYLEKPDWISEEIEASNRIHNVVGKIAWQDYQRLMGHNHHSDEENNG